MAIIRTRKMTMLSENSTRAWPRSDAAVAACASWVHRDLAGEVGAAARVRDLQRDREAGVGIGLRVDVRRVPVRRRTGAVAVAVAVTEVPRPDRAAVPASCCAMVGEVEDGRVLEAAGRVDGEAACGAKHGTGVGVGVGAWGRTGGRVRGGFGGGLRRGRGGRLGVGVGMAAGSGGAVMIWAVAVEANVTSCRR